MQYKENIRQDLIRQEFERIGEDAQNFAPLIFTENIIKILCDNYNCVECLEKYYDSEPFYYKNMDSDGVEDLLTKEMCHTLIFHNIEAQEEVLERYGYSLEDITNAHKDFMRQLEEYEESGRRLEFNNWFDVYAKGVWGLTQAEVNLKVEQILRHIQEHAGVFKPIQDYKDRIYYLKTNSLHNNLSEVVSIYFYGRDLIQRDYWFTFKLK